MKKPYFYSQDEFLSCGVLGEGWVEMQAWITDNGTEAEPFISIVAAVIYISYPTRHTSVLDFMPKLLSDADEMFAWKKKIIADWRKRKERDEEAG